MSNLFRIFAAQTPKNTQMITACDSEIGIASKSDVVISHVRQSDMEIQSNDNHQNGVAIVASKFASAFGAVTAAN